jgi:hypothetical protein
MDALLYSGPIVGLVLILAGIYLLIKRVRGFQTEVEIAGFGTIKTVHHGLALTFLGVALLLQSSTALQQRDELKRSLEQLKGSQALIVSFLKPSLLADTAFQNYFKAAPQNQQEAILRRAIGMLRPEFRRVTDSKRSEFEEKDFGNVSSIYNFLFEVDPNDGSALYYKGEVQRLLRKRYLMRENFHLYLTHAPAPKAIQPELRTLGYFDERTAWIHHLLSNDFLCEALQASNLQGRSDLLRLVEKHAKGVREYRAEGFNGGETTLSTENLERATKEEPNKIPRPKCPVMS